MIGNDVIDVLQSRKESNWQRRGFIAKLFTIEEQLLISGAADPEITVWLLWSMKEAAYKVYNRQTKIREYIPQKLTCAITEQNHNLVIGIVTCFENVYYTKTILSKEHIHTIAVTVSDHLNNVTEIEKKSIMKDQNGIPYFVTSQNIIQDASVSHHGRFEKVVILNTEN